MFTYVSLITLLQLYYKATCQHLCILSELQYPRYLQHFEKIKHNSKFASYLCRFHLQEWGLSFAYLDEMMLI